MSAGVCTILCGRAWTGGWPDGRGSGSRSLFVSGCSQRVGQVAASDGRCGIRPSSMRYIGRGSLDARRNAPARVRLASSRKPHLRPAMGMEIRQGRDSGCPGSVRGTTALRGSPNNRGGVAQRWRDVLVTVGSGGVPGVVRCPAACRPSCSKGRKVGLAFNGKGKLVLVGEIGVQASIEVRLRWR